MDRMALMGNAARVGALLLVFVGLLVGFLAFFGARIWGADPDVYFATFKDAGGVSSGTRVLLAGVQVGTVGTIGLADPRTARLELLMNEGTRLPIGTRAEIATSLVGLGDTPVTLVPPAEPGGGTMPVGTTIEGLHPGPLDGVLPDSKRTVQALTDVLVEVREVLRDRELRGSANSLIKNLSATLVEVQKLTARSERLLARSEGDVLGVLKSGRQAAGNVERATGNLARLSGDPAIERDVKALSQRLLSLSARADRLVASLDRAVNDPSLRGPLSRSAASAERIALQGEKIAGEVAKLTETGGRIAANAETVSANLAKASERATPLAEKVEALAEGAKGIEERVDSLLRKFGGRRAGDAAPAPSKGPLFTTSADLLRESEPNRFRNDFNLTFALSEGAVVGGVFDAFGSPRLNLQLARPLGPASLRYGIYAGRPGAGVDWNFARNLGFRADVWDLNKPRLDARLRIGLGKGLVGWIGADRIGAENAFTFGLGIRR